MKSVKFLLTAVFLSVASYSNAGLITFDEFAADNANGPMPANRYSGLGVTFVATDDGTTWGGLTNGDPGNWDIDGTNGPVFSGFNGQSDGLAILFNNPISGFSLDASRSNGSVAGDALVVEGWLNGSLVDSVNLVFGSINNWTTFSLNGVFDEVKWVGQAAGSNFNPFGVDNLVWDDADVPEPAALGLLGLGLAGLGLVRRRRLQA